MTSGESTARAMSSAMIPRLRSSARLAEIQLRSRLAGMASGSPTHLTISCALTPAARNLCSFQALSRVSPSDPEREFLESIIRIRSSCSFGRRRCEFQQPGGLGFAGSREPTVPHSDVAFFSDVRVGIFISGGWAPSPQWKNDSTRLAISTLKQNRGCAPSRAFSRRGPSLRSQCGSFITVVQ